MVSGNLLCNGGSSNSELFDNLEWQNVVRGGKEVQEGWYGCISRTDACLNMVDTNTIL